MLSAICEDAQKMDKLLQIGMGFLSSREPGARDAFLSAFYELNVRSDQKLL